MFIESTSPSPSDAAPRRVSPPAWARALGALFAASAAVLALPSCGAKTDLPSNPNERRPPPGSYRLQHIWNDMGNVTDILITSLGDLFLAVDSSDVRQYYRTSSPRLGNITFSGLTHPVYITESSGETLYVADAGPPPKVYRFAPGGGAPVDSLQDPAWYRLSGVAAGPTGRLFVGARIRSIKPTPPPPETTYTDVIFRYSSLHAVRDTLRRFDVLTSPRGLVRWANSLLTAKPETGEMERMNANEGTITELIIGGRTVFPMDVSVDDSLNIFIADAGAGKIFRYSWLGDLLSTIPDSTDTDPLAPFVNPSAVTSSFDYIDHRSEIWTADPGEGTVKRWKATQGNVE